MNPFFRSHLAAIHLLVLMLYALPGSSARAATVELDGQQFTLPDGFSIELVAQPPLVNRPICADFDEQGRLYVADSSGSNDNVKIQLENRPHRVVRLEDTNGDGRFDNSVVFADKMMFPEGAMWHDGSLYVSAPPVIWKLTDLDQDGVADQRDVWFDGKTLTGCANDLHGPYLGPDGWIYWCKGAFAEQTYERPDGASWVTRAAHIFRRRPSGGTTEAVMTGGMDNPVEVVFTPGGERIFTTTFLCNPAGGLRDGLIHAVYGGVYGKVHGVLDGHPRTGAIMPVLAHLGAAAPCGLARLESEQLGAVYRDNVLACLFNMHKITRHVLQKSGAGFESHTSDFLVSDNLDFHPTDVMEDADGSLVVINTGGWYKLCCPTSQLWKPDILGAIYRIRRSGSHQRKDPRGKTISWPSLSNRQLIDLLADPRFAIRNRARQALGKHGVEAVANLAQVVAASPTRQQRLHAVWALTQIDGSEARKAVRHALDDEDETVRQAALHSISVTRDQQAEEAVVTMLDSPSLHNRRAAAEALGRIGSADAVPHLLAAAAHGTDRILEHSLIHASLEIGNVPSTRLALEDDHPRVRRAAMIALDQIPDGNLRVTDIQPYLESDDADLADAAWWVVEHRPDWAAGLVGYFRREIARKDSQPEALVQLSTRLARFAHDDAVQQVMADALTGDTTSDETRLTILDSMVNCGRLKSIPDVWSKPLLDLLSTTDSSRLRKTVSAVHALSNAKPPEAYVHRLREIADNEELSDYVRLQALAAIPSGQRTIGPGLLQFLGNRLSAERTVAVRSLAVDILHGTTLSNDQLVAICGCLGQTGPMELKRLMEIYAKSSDGNVGTHLVASLQQCPAATSLTVDTLKEQLAGYGEEIQRQAQPLMDRIVQENGDKLKQLQTILALVKQGDIRRGQKIFHSNKAACISCHGMGYLGGRVGPDLTRIGKIRSDRDLLASILFPSASFVRSYEPTTIVTVDGLVLNGVLKDESDDHVVLALDAQKVVRLSHDQIDERQPGKVSIMPEGLEKHFTPQQLADLVVFLKASK